MSTPISIAVHFLQCLKILISYAPHASMNAPTATSFNTNVSVTTTHHQQLCVDTTATHNIYANCVTTVNGTRIDHYLYYTAEWLDSILEEIHYMRESIESWRTTEAYQAPLIVKNHRELQNKLLDVPAECYYLSTLRSIFLIVICARE